MLRPFPILIHGLTIFALAFAGCRSADPYCQQAISNLRAEKIQLENEFYALKSQYESDMARVGQTPSYNPYNTPVTPSIMDGEIIYGGDYYSDQNIGVGGGQNVAPSSRNLANPTLANRMGNLRSSSGTDSNPANNPNSSLAGHIRSIEVNQIPAGADETTRLLIRPLDGQGAILPVTGDLRVRLYDPATGGTIYENEFAATQVQTWINDQPGQQPGIHMPIPRTRNPSLSDRLVCDLQYRTSDNRILKQSTELLFGSTAMPVTRVRPDAGRQASNGAGNQAGNARTTSQPIHQPESIEGELEIEIGDELNFDSLDNADSENRPTWSPDR